MNIFTSILGCKGKIIFLFAKSFNEFIFLLFVNGVEKEEKKGFSI